MVTEAMGRTAKFKVVKFVKNTSGGPVTLYRVNVPIGHSSSGSRKQPSFPTRSKATTYSKELKERQKRVGLQSLTLSLYDSEDAAKAINMLQGHNVALTEVARFWLDHHDARAKAPTVGAAWEEGIGIKERQGASAKYLVELRAWQRKIPDALKSMNLVDVDADCISSFLDKISGGKAAWKNGKSYFSAIFGLQVKKKRIRENPCAGIIAPKIKSTDEVVIYTIPEIRALFDACREYPASLDRDCKSCAVPFAFLAFAGIRPDELTRMNWSDVRSSQSFIRLGGTITKTGETRNIPINATLKAWIATVPDKLKSGKIVPTRWLRKAARVKREAGLDGRHLQDALRHSFASYLVAIDHNVDAVISAMGHRDKRVFTKHYHNAVERSVAEEYWATLPQLSNSPE